MTGKSFFAADKAGEYLGPCLSCIRQRKQILPELILLIDASFITKFFVTIFRYILP